MKKKFFEIAAVMSLAHALRGTGCGVCGDASEKPKPIYLTNGVKSINSGINGWIAFHCSILPTIDLTDATTWTTFTEDANPLLLGRGGACSGVSGDKPVGTPVYVPFGACGKEIVTSVTRAFNIVDKGNDELLSVDSLYCFMTDCADQYSIALTTCDGRMYPPLPATKFFADPVETASSDDIREWNITIEYKTDGLTCLIPTKPVGLNGQWGVIQGQAAGATGRRTVKKGKTAPAVTS